MALKALQLYAGTGHSWQAGCGLRLSPPNGWGPADAPAFQKVDPGPGPPLGPACDGLRGPAGKHAGMAGG